MINIVRSDGMVLVISSARTLMEIRGGLVVDFGDDDTYLVTDFSFVDLSKFASGHFSNLITVHHEWHGWPG